VSKEMERADPSSLTEADIERAIRNVEKTRRLLQQGKTPYQLIMGLLELISFDKPNGKHS